MKAKRRRIGLIFISIAVLAMILVVALSATALAGGKQYTFDPKKFDMSKFDKRIDWSNVGWCNFDFGKFDMSHFDWSKFDWKHFHWGCKPHNTTTTTECTTETTVDNTTTTSEATTDTTVNDVSSDTTEAASDTTEVTTPVIPKDINTGGGGTSGPGVGTWALGFFALALAGGLGWTALRPAIKRK